MQVLEPQVTVELLKTKPNHLASYKNVWKVVVTPVIVYDKPYQAKVIGASNMRTGSIQMENLGRIGLESERDSRPCAFFVFGDSGSQSFKVLTNINVNNYKMVTVNFS